jgi:putative transposase
MFSGRHFLRSVILLCVRGLKPQLPRPEEMKAVRRLRVDHSTIDRWAVRSSPLSLKRFNRRKAHGHRQEIIPMMDRGQARYCLNSPV